MTVSSTLSGTDEITQVSLMPAGVPCPVSCWLTRVPDHLVWVALVTRPGNAASAAAARQICRGGGVGLTGNQPLWGRSLMSHPVLLDALVREHQADLLRAAEQHRLARSRHRSSLAGPVRPVRPVRSPRPVRWLRAVRARTGWALVELGCASRCARTG